MLLGDQVETNTAHVVESLAVEIADVEQQICRMIRHQAQSNEHDDLWQIYADEIQSLDERLGIMKQELLRRTQQAIAKEQVKQTGAASLMEIKVQSLYEFWKMSDREINQMLHRLFGKRRLVVKNAQIVGIADYFRRIAKG